MSAMGAAVSPTCNGRRVGRRLHQAVAALVSVSSFPASSVKDTLNLDPGVALVAPTGLSTSVYVCQCLPHVHRLVAPVAGMSATARACAGAVVARVR